MNNGMNLLDRFKNAFGQNDGITAQFRAAQGPAPAHAAQISGKHTLLERMIRDEFHMLKHQNGENAFLLYLHEEGHSLPRPLRVTTAALEDATLAQTMRAILMQPDLAIVLDLRAHASFEQQWPYEPGSIEAMDYFKAHGPHLPQQFKFLQMNMQSAIQKTAPDASAA